MVVSHTSSTLTVQDKNNILYTFPIDKLNIDNGSKIVIEYTGLLNQNNEMQDVSIMNYNVSTLSDDDDNHCNFTAGSMPKTYTFRDGILYEGIKL